MGVLLMRHLILDDAPASWVASVDPSVYEVASTASGGLNTWKRYAVRVVCTPWDVVLIPCSPDLIHGAHKQVLGNIERAHAALVDCEVAQW